MKTTIVMLVAMIATLTAGAASAAQVANVSMRARVGEGQEVLIMGLYVRSEAVVLIRGVGPSLTQFDITGVLEDPMLTVFDSRGHIVAEALGFDTLNFLQHEYIVGLGDRLGAFPITGLPKDAGLAVRLAPGAYTVHLRSISGGSGIALAEVYFDDQPSS
jgi:hypothetical protein